MEHGFAVQAAADVLEAHDRTTTTCTVRVSPGLSPSRMLSPIGCFSSSENVAIPHSHDQGRRV
jgi:hypothetical protein